ncbi:hypothetical protein E0I26_02095 [Flavobacterium rhamnosiphilum]|uniref:Uncharacterized protein n=1 Tax=Flavobacterium rhamnosiphilum TaxID=2541724 RepID=A0A4R5FD67_9FLAO|nr:hypothetical protein [Flavobacterium rhamnosiphilum]TDE46900.1 hypothetical protein E0I26_02095 [Flavobacterium rhamnosiphilum]
MQEIKQIYHNNLGTAFYWRKDNAIVLDKVQLVFREMGFYFTPQELQLFKRCIEDSYIQNKCCDDCELKNKCHKFLLKTPCSQIDLAVSMEELDAVKDLVEGTLFKINLDDYLYGVGMN